MSAPYVAFGDDSLHQDFAAFAFVLVPRTRLNSARRKLDQIKRRFNIPTSTVLHCRTLFNGRQREKMGLSHLAPGDVRAIVAQAITAINEVHGRVHYAVQNFTAFVKQLGSDLHFHSNDGTASVTLPVSVDPKGLLGMLAIACFPLVNFHVNGPSAAQCEIFVSEDRTKISFLGERRTRADSLYAGFLDTGSALMQLNAHVVAADADPLLQLADIAAYVCSHAAVLGSEDGFWREQLARVIHWYKVG
ncbi:hypothetical protein N5J06_22810 [Ralstonia sp. CHL-2022]|uniref:DUF3800 domain-containing protein n=1 Tax=Ralstonia mojiangensis TaxID=2953895 RepID=A0ABT2LEI2_9RALS|nr:hypothetical protein [Ralstonia mojiangensis]MCT7313812.1 hypothetical protein [Ralstonia mojiangensis]